MKQEEAIKTVDNVCKSLSNFFITDFFKDIPLEYQKKVTDIYGFLDLNLKSTKLQRNESEELSTKSQKNPYQLTNLTISTKFKNTKFYIFKKDILAALAMWIVKQNPNKEIPNINRVLMAYKNYFDTVLIVESEDVPILVTYNLLETVINETLFASIPEIRELNDLSPDFIALGALAKNVFFQVLKDYIIDTDTIEKDE